MDMKCHGKASCILPKITLSLWPITPYHSGTHVSGETELPNISKNA
jgi:hypothetical protein